MCVCVCACVCVLIGVHSFIFSGYEYIRQNTFSSSNILPRAYMYTSTVLIRMRATLLAGLRKH